MKKFIPIAAEHKHEFTGCLPLICVSVLFWIILIAGALHLTGGRL